MQNTDKKPFENKQEKKSKSFEEMTDEEFEKQIALAKSGGLAIN